MKKFMGFRSRNQSGDETQKSKTNRKFLFQFMYNRTFHIIKSHEKLKKKYSKEVFFYELLIF